jgi:hypothetical protein
MSEAIHFDTHKFVKRMTETGMSEATAEALADEQLQLINGELANKQDMAQLDTNLQLEIEKVNSGLQLEIDKVHSNLQLEIEKVKSELVRWMAGLLIAQGGVIIAAIRIFPA